MFSWISTPLRNHSPTSRLWSRLKLVALFAVLVFAVPLLTNGARPAAIAAPIVRPPALPLPDKEGTLEDLGNAVAFSPNDARLMTVGDHLQSFIYDRDHPQLNWVRLQHDLCPGSAAWSPDGKLIACGYGGIEEKEPPRNILVLMDTKTGKIVRDLIGHRAAVYRQVFSPDGKLLASGSEDKTVRLWEVATGKQLRVLRGHNWPVRDVCFSSDGKRLVSSADSEDVRIWSVETGELLTTIKTGSNTVSSAAFRPGNGDLLAITEYHGDVGKRSHIVGLWDVSNLKRPVKLIGLKGHKDHIRRVAFHKDGRHLASSDHNGMVYIWDLDTKKPLHRLNHIRDAVDLSWSGDGKRLAVATSGTGTVTIWNFEPRDDN